MTNAWEVLIDDTVLDTVFFRSEMTESQVKQTLINRDGYPPNIQLNLEDVLDTSDIG